MAVRVSNSVTVELPSEFASALEKLQRIFSGALWDAKVNSCFAAWSDIKRAKSAKTKVEIFNQKAQQWREYSVKTIREWLPQFVDLARAYSEIIEVDALRWTKDKVWEKVEAQCEIHRLNPGEPLTIDSISRTMVYWFAVAAEGNIRVGKPNPGNR
jgi:hypothetical protein